MISSSTLARFCFRISSVCIFLNFFRSCNRRKLTQKLAESEEGLASSLQKASNAEKARNRLNSELEDALIDLEKVTRVSLVLSTQTTWSFSDEAINE